MEEERTDKQTTEESTDSRLRETTERIWERTRKTFSSATNTAGQYGRIVQKKIDLGSMHRKINSCYTDLGAMIDKGRLEENEHVLESAEVQAMFSRLDDLRNQAAQLESEIETLKAEARQTETH